MPRLFALLSLLFASGTHCCFIHAVELKNPFQSNKYSTKEKTFNPLLLQGALSSIIHREYSEPNVGVVVDSIGGVTLLYLPTNTRIRESILSFVKSYPNVTSVNVKELKEFKPQQTKWFIPFPHTVIFSPLLANPLELEMGWAGYLYNTEVPINKENSLVTDYAIGLYIPLMRWLYTFNTKISAQFDFFAVNYGILKVLQDQQLREIDYKIACIGSFTTGPLSYRFSFWHLCSHLGDMLAIDLKNNNNYRKSINIFPFEMVISVQTNKYYRLYFGGAVTTLNQSSNYFIYGGELYCFPFKPIKSHFFCQPFLAVDIQNWERFNYEPSTSVKGGISWGRLPQACKQGRIALIYHNGLGNGPYLFQRFESLSLGIEYGF